MSDRFKDWMVFTGTGTAFAIVAFVVAGLWTILTTSPDLPFCERWAPVADLPWVAPKPKRPPPVPQIRTDRMFFCDRYVSINACRVA